MIVRIDASSARNNHRPDRPGTLATSEHQVPDALGGPRGVFRPAGHPDEHLCASALPLDPLESLERTCVQTVVLPGPCFGNAGRNHARSREVSGGRCVAAPVVLPREHAHRRCDRPSCDGRFRRRGDLAEHRRAGADGRAARFRSRGPADHLSYRANGERDYASSDEPVGVRDSVSEAAALAAVTSRIVIGWRACTSCRTLRPARGRTIGII